MYTNISKVSIDLLYKETKIVVPQQTSEMNPYKNKKEDMTAQNGQR